MGFATNAIHVGQEPDPATRCHERDRARPSCQRSLQREVQHQGECRDHHEPQREH